VDDVFGTHNRNGKDGRRGHAGPGENGGGGIPAAARPACRHLASFAKGTEVVISAPLRLT
jgi:hypothetical protein